MATFPGGIKTFTTLVDLIDSILASHQNDRGAEITAIETWLRTNALREGQMINGRIAPSVAANNLTLALKTLAGTDPSATNPVYVMIGGVLRTITAALSVAPSAGLNFFNCGSAELAAKEVDYFAYLGYNVTDGVVIGLARIPYATVYSDFSITYNNEKYASISTIVHAAASDAYCVIGRFAATLSAAAAYNWSVPAYTPANLVQRPIFETRVLTWLPTYTGYTGAVTTTLARYQLVMNRLTLTNRFSGTSNATTLTFTLPFSPALAGNGLYVFCRGTDNGIGNKLAMVGPTATNVMTAYTDAAATGWTNPGTKGLDGPLATWDI